MDEELLFIRTNFRIGSTPPSPLPERQLLFYPGQDILILFKAEPRESFGLSVIGIYSIQYLTIPLCIGTAEITEFRWYERVRFLMTLAFFSDEQQCLIEFNELHFVLILFESYFKGFLCWKSFRTL